MEFITDPTTDETLSRIDILIEKKYPGRLKEMWGIIKKSQTEYDDSQFLEEDILESILMELDII